jgi:polysaccharide pyruvyl transferase WcaK-like protein
MKKKRAFLAYSFSANNAGDFALTVAAINILIKNGFEVVLVSRFRANTNEYVETNNYYTKNYNGQVRMFQSPFLLNRNAGVFRNLYNNIHGILVLLGLINNKQIIQEIKNSDIVMIGAGNFLRCSSFADYMRLRAFYFPLKIAQKLNKEFIILPQSTAEIKSFGIHLLAKFIKRSKVTFIREHLSYEKLTRLFPTSNIIETLDLAFFLQDESVFKIDNNKKKKIAVTLRVGGIGGLREFNDTELNKIKKRVHNCINSLKSKNDFYFIMQATHEDLVFTQEIKDEIYELYQYDIPIVEEHDPIELISLYSSFDLLIGMRLHSIILAACGGTPSYGLFFKEWGLKNPGILDTLGLPYTMIDDDVDIRLNEVERLLDCKKEFQQKIKEFYNNESPKFVNVLRTSIK